MSSLSGLFYIGLSPGIPSVVHWLFNTDSPYGRILNVNNELVDNVNYVGHGTTGGRKNNFTYQTNVVIPLLLNGITVNAYTAYDANGHAGYGSGGYGAGRGATGFEIAELEGDSVYNTPLISYAEGVYYGVPGIIIIYSLDNNITDNNGYVTSYGSYTLHKVSGKPIYYIKGSQTENIQGSFSINDDRFTNIVVIGPGGRGASGIGPNGIYSGGGGGGGALAYANSSMPTNIFGDCVTLGVYTFSLSMTETQDAIGTSYISREEPPPCFVKGSRVLTPSGYKKIETLQNGDTVLTADNRNVSIKLYSFTTIATTETAPYKIQAGALGANIPSADLHVSPRHAVKDSKGRWQIPKYLGNNSQQYGIGESVTYYHIECPNYYTDNVIVEGTVVESFKNKQGLPGVTYIWNEGGWDRTHPNKIIEIPKKPSTYMIYSKYRGV
jgi:hypothetical protein